MRTKSPFISVYIIEDTFTTGRMDQCTNEMKNNKFRRKKWMKTKKIFILATISMVITMCFSFLCGCANKKSEDEIARNIIMQETKIEVPINSEIVYHVRDKTGFLTGRNAQYTVFYFESEPTDWLNENSFETGRNEEFEMYFRAGSETLPIEKEEISKDFFPDFEREYIYMRTVSSVEFVYVPQKQILIVQISGY